MNDAMQYVFDYLGDNEVWIDVMPQGNIFAAEPAKTFTKSNFDIFLYDPETKYAAIRPAKGMHKRMHDGMEHMPTPADTAELFIEGQVAVYHLQGYDNKWDEYMPMEWAYSITPEEFKAKHPNCISLIAA